MDGNTDQKGKNLIPHASDGGDSRPVKNFSTLVEEKGLAIVLAVLCLVAVVLAGFVIAGLSNREATEPATAEADDSNGEIQSYTITSEGYTEDEPKELEDVRKRVADILDDKNVTAGEIVGLYSGYIEKYAAEGNSEQTSAYIWDRNDKLIAAGFEREALDTLLETDFSVLNEVDQYRQYANIVALARSLGLYGVESAYYSILTSKVDWGNEAIERMTERNSYLKQVNNGDGS